MNIREHRCVYLTEFIASTDSLLRHDVCQEHQRSSHTIRAHAGPSLHKQFRSVQLVAKVYRVSMSGAHRPARRHAAPVCCAGNKNACDGYRGSFGNPGSTSRSKSTTQREVHHYTTGCCLKARPL